jgi:hypothetical protein
MQQMMHLAAGANGCSSSRHLTSRSSSQGSSRSIPAAQVNFMLWILLLKEGSSSGCARWQQLQGV